MEILFIEPINKIGHIYKFESSHYLLIRFKAILYSQIDRILVVLLRSFLPVKEFNLLTWMFFVLSIRLVTSDEKSFR